MNFNFNLDYLTILEIGGILWAGLWMVGLLTLFMGRHAARREFRGKGYVRPPQGKSWFPFLLEKQYAIFDQSDIRFFFGIAHICLVAMLLISAALLLLVGCNTLFSHLGGP